ncbi:unnamed protein product [Clonostachys byssicola]|uniref:Uncharacterized protein n=1 Tax=Clonostachys byssicola TaxID=160290 RepID=A0A9N9Y6J0_9HYPO|nr:unnamed protein product [Clonostachys byssicola]
MTCSPVGHYIVDCQEIEQGWDNVKDLTLDINETDQDGIFRVVFDFSILVGVMLICTDKGKLNAHLSYLGDEYESDEGGTEESDSDEKEHAEDDDEGEIDDMSGDADRGSGTRGRKRKSQASPRHEPRKKSRTDGAQELQYFIKFRCRETGEGELYPEPEDGTLRYEGKRMAAFLGKVDMPCVGGQIPFAARKISNVAKPNRKSWADYSDSEYEYVYV